MSRIFRQPASWFAALLVWFAALWFLSSQPGSSQSLPVPHLDKLAHFVYFFGGAILLVGWRISHHPDHPAWRNIIVTTIVALALIGALDEWHQTFTPDRSGLDLWDWLADLAGASAGTFVTKFLHRHLQ